MHQPEATEGGQDRVARLSAPARTTARATTSRSPTQAAASSSAQRSVANLIHARKGRSSGTAERATGRLPGNGDDRAAGALPRGRKHLALLGAKAEEHPRGHDDLAWRGRVAEVIGWSVATSQGAPGMLGPCRSTVHQAGTQPGSEHRRQYEQARDADDCRDGLVVGNGGVTNQASPRALVAARANRAQASPLPTRRPWPS